MKKKQFPGPKKIPAKEASPADKAFTEQKDMILYESLFWSTFKGLPDPCRKILLMHWRDLNHKEIGLKLKTTETRAKEETRLCTRKFVERVKQHKDYKLFSRSSFKRDPET